MISIYDSRITYRVKESAKQFIVTGFGVDLSVDIQAELVLVQLYLPA